MKIALIIAGQISSGKTTLARLLAESLAGAYTSFGDEVRSRAFAANRSLSRQSLQELGEELVQSEPDRFVESVLARSQPSLSQVSTLIIDGVRHLSIAEVLQRKLGNWDARLVYLYTSADIRRTRTMLKGVASSEAFRASTHPSEGQADDLQARADIVVVGDDILYAKEAILTAIRQSMPLSTKMDHIHGSRVGEPGSAFLRERVAQSPESAHPRRAAALRRWSK